MRMKRLCILSIYDHEGIVDEYLLFFIEAILVITSKLVIIVNGKLTDESFYKVKKYTKYIYRRENTGYDAGAYKHVLELLPEKEISSYDEIVLTNDTCFGPFVSFESIFQNMEARSVDFWGINYIDDGITAHLQSNFLVFRHTVLNDLVRYFEDAIDQNATAISEVYTKFELGLFCYLKKKNYKFGYYSGFSNLDVYKSPDFAISVYHYPFMKKKCFSQKHLENDNCISALKIIEENYDYDLEYILKCIKRIYQISYDLQFEFKRQLQTKEKYVKIANIKEAEIISFCNKFNHIYIYGAGIWAKKIYYKYREYFIDFQGFIVSDDNFSPDGELYGYKIKKFSDIHDSNRGIIVALSQKNTLEVKGKLYKYNALFFWNE